MNNTNDINAKTGVHEAVSSTEFVTETSNYTRTDNRNETEISSSSKNKSKKIPWIVNLTGKDYSIALDFKIIIKQLREHKNIKILNMNGCALKPEYSVLLFATLRKLASVDAFDLSNNQLSEPVEIQLIDYLRARKSTPQYVLLHNNTVNGSPMMFTPNSLNHGDGSNKKAILGSSTGNGSTVVGAFIHDLVTSFTSDTWGISLTLPDFPPSSVIHTPNLVKTTDKRSTKRNEHSSSGPNASNKIYENNGFGITTPTSQNNYYVTVEFLKRLNASLLLQYREDMEESGLLWDVNNAKAFLKKKPKSKEKDTKAKPAHTVSNTHEKSVDARVAGRGLRNLSILALRDTKLCKQSISLLENTLELGLNTLTELDLSNAYIGYRGACVISKHLLKLRAPQIILNSLRLRGNGLGDAGALVLANAFKESQTLTYLDLSSNNMTDVGIGHIVTNVVHNQILHRIDLQNRMVDVCGEQSLSGGLVVEGVSVKAIYHNIEVLMEHGACMEVEFSDIYCYKPRSCVRQGGRSDSDSDYIEKYSEINMKNLSPNVSASPGYIDNTSASLNNDSNDSVATKCEVIYHNTVKKSSFSFIPHEHCSVLYTVNINTLLSQLNLKLKGEHISSANDVNGVCRGDQSDIVDTVVSDAGYNIMGMGTHVKIEFEFQIEGDNHAFSGGVTHSPSVLPAFSYGVSIRPSVVEHQVDPAVDVNIDDVDLINEDLTDVNCTAHYFKAEAQVDTQSKVLTQWIRCCCSIPTQDLINAMRAITVLEDTPSGVLVLTLTCKNSITMVRAHPNAHQQMLHQSTHINPLNASLKTMSKLSHVRSHPHAHAVSAIMSDAAIKEVCTNIATRNLLITLVKHLEVREDAIDRRSFVVSRTPICGNKQDHSTNAFINSITENNTRDQFYYGKNGNSHNKLGLQLPADFVVNKCLTVPAGIGMGHLKSGVTVAFDLRVRGKEEIPDFAKYVDQHKHDESMVNISYHWQLLIYRPYLSTDALILLEEHSEYIIDGNELRIGDFFKFQHYEVSLPNWIADNDIVVLAIKTTGCTAKQQIDHTKPIPESDLYIEIPSLHYCLLTNELDIRLMAGIEEKQMELQAIDQLPANMVHNMQASYCM